jgi:hypothetical protein
MQSPHTRARQVYFLAWLFDLLLPTLGVFLVVLITVPAARPLCFPPASLVVIDHATSGNAPAPPGADEAFSHDSATGAPQAAKGEAAEQEATSFVNSLGSLAVGLGTGTGAWRGRGAARGLTGAQQARRRRRARRRASCPTPSRPSGA